MRGDSPQGRAQLRAFRRMNPVPHGGAKRRHSCARRETSCSGGSGRRQPAHLWPLSHRQEKNALSVSLAKRNYS